MLVITEIFLMPMVSPNVQNTPPAETHMGYTLVPNKIVQNVPNIQSYDAYDKDGNYHHQVLKNTERGTLMPEYYHQHPDSDSNPDNLMYMHPGVYKQTDQSPMPYPGNEKPPVLFDPSVPET